MFGGEQARATVGNAVNFVLWFNFLAGFAYVLTGAGLLALATSLVALAFGLHAMAGGLYEMRTVGALSVRLAFWTLVFAMARRALKPAD